MGVYGWGLVFLFAIAIGVCFVFFCFVYFMVNGSIEVGLYEETNVFLLLR